MIAALRSALFALVFYAGTIGYVLATVPAALIGWTALARVVRSWCDFHYACARWLLGIRLEVTGEPPSGAVLVASKHESMYETLAFFRLFRNPVVMAKRELTQIPVWGWAAKFYGIIPVDRGASATALRAMLRAAAAAAEAGRPIVIFPEGTRVPHGEVGAMKPGFAGLYLQLGLPVVPVALDCGRLWPKGFVKHPGTIRFHFGEPIPPGLKRRDAEARVLAAINALNS